MSVTNPANRTPRRVITGEENEYVKMFDPPTQSPETPELMAPSNPVPAFMAAQGLIATPTPPNTVQQQLLTGKSLTSWDGAHTFGLFTFSEPGNSAAPGGQWPAHTIRVPRGVIFHAESVGAGPPPHTIHWHGIEPTPINDGVGHCSMEIGRYTYQWQPNYVGTYFRHCHRNTVQHFDFGLYGMLLIEPPDAYDPSIPINPGEGPKNVGGYPRRTAAGLSRIQGMAANPFPGFNANPLESMDPHAHTVPYDVESLWVLDDIDSNWHTLASNARATFPQSGTIPGVNDNFHGQVGGVIPAGGFFAFNDFNPDYFFCTGVPFPGPVGGSATLNPSGAPPLGGGLPGGLVPPGLNSGVTGMQVAVNAGLNKTVLVRCLDAAYCPIRVTFPIDVVIIAWDGRALGVPPWSRYNYPYMVPANTPIEVSTARRFDALIRQSTAFHGAAKVEFFSHLRTDPTTGQHVKLFEGLIPIDIA